MKYIIYGKVVAKKNNLKIFKAGRKRWIGPNERYRDWAGNAVFELLIQKRKGRRKTIPESTKLFVVVTQYLGKGQRMDTDNTLGGVFDCLEHAGIIENDNQIVAHFMSKKRDVSNPRVEISLYESDKRIVDHLMAESKVVLLDPVGEEFRTTDGGIFYADDSRKTMKSGGIDVLMFDDSDDHE